jgi:hypothetical protein
MSSAFTLLLENTRRGGNYMPVAIMQVTIVMSELLSPENKEWIRHLAFREITLHTSC